MTERRSPSSAMAAPLVVLMVRTSGSKAFDGAGLVGVYFEEVLGAGHRQHRLDAFLDARELQLTAGVDHLTIQVHEAADGRAVHVRHGTEVDHNPLLTRGDQLADGGGEVAEDWIHQARLADPDDRDRALLLCFDIHHQTPVRVVLLLRGSLSPGPVGLYSFPRSLRICRASSVRPRLIRDLTVPSGRRNWSAISWYDSSWMSRMRTAVRRVSGSAESACLSSITRSRCSSAATGLGSAAAGASSPASTSRSIVSRSLRTLR